MRLSYRPNLADPRENERAQALFSILVAGALIQIGLIAIFLIFRVGLLRDFKIYILMLALHLIQLGFVWRGWVRFSAISHTLTYLVVVLGAMYSFGGIRTPAGFVLPPAVLVAGLVWSGRAAIGVAVVASAAGLGLVYLEAHGALPRRVEAPPVRLWGVMTGALIVTAVLLHVALRAIRRAEDQRRRLEEQLTEAQRVEALGRLAGGVAHDFNNLLTVILGSAGMLDSRGSPLLEEARSAIEQAARRAADITRQLLAIGRKQVLEPVVVDLNAAVRAAERILRSFTTEAVQLDLDLAPEPIRVLIDRAQLDQILLNLVINARDAMPKGGDLRIVSRAEAGFGILEVRDAGEGMSESVRQRIFEPFFTTKRLGAGTGLGLATVYGIVHQSGGNISVETELGKGSCFTVRLPRTLAELSGTQEIQVRRQTPAMARILLVDDDEGVRKVMAGILTQAGYAVTALGSPVRAFDFGRDDLSKFDLLVSDVVMPTLSGPELAAQLLRTHPSLRVVFATGYADDQLEEHGALSGRFRLLRKPFVADELLSIVSEVLSPAPNPTR